MMLTLETTAQFRRDYKRVKKRGYDLALLENVIDALLNGEKLAERHRDHPFTGPWEAYRECHILPDWLLIYRVDGARLILVAARTGTHVDLFDE